MARLDALPSIEIIRGLKGVLDFYLWKGLPCVRSWPYTPPSKRTTATKAAATLFGQISSNFRLLAPLALQAFQQEANDQPRTARDLYISGVYGHLHTKTPAAPPPPEEQMYDAYVCLRDVKPQATAGGTFTGSAWQTRDLNEEQADPENICALAANQFTLPAGTYRAMISCPAYRIGCHQARLYIPGDAALVLQGTTERAYDADRIMSRSFIVGRFTLAAEKTLEVQHRCTATFANTGFGTAASFADEVYTVAEFWRETT